MSLDPYRDWLQIEDPRRPLSHYALLGLKPFEQDTGRIQEAYARSMVVVRKYQVGAHMEVAQRVISELSEAYATLTHPQQRQAYNAALRGGETYGDRPAGTVAEPRRPPSHARLAAPPIAPPRPEPEPEQSSLRLQEAETPAAASEAPEPPQPRRGTKQPPATVASYAGVVAALVALLFWALEDDSPPVVPTGPTGARAVVRPVFPTARPPFTPPSRARTPFSLPPAAPPPSTAAPPAVPVPKLSPWDQQLSDSEDAWNTLHDIKPGDRLVLSAAFVSYGIRPRLPAELRLRLRTSTIRIKSPFLPPGDAFLQQLQPDDRLDLEVTVVDPSRSDRGVELNWIARAGAAASQRVICRPASTISLAQTIDVNPARPINALAWSPDGSQLIVVAQPVTLWDISTGVLLSTLNDPECLRATWSSDGGHIALVEDEQDRIVICDPAGKLVTVLPTRADNGALVASNPKQPLMALVARSTADFNSPMYVGLMKSTNKPAAEVLGNLTGTPRVAWNSDGTRLALAGRHASGFRGIRVSKLNARNLLARVEDVAFPDTVDDLQWVPGRDLLAVYASRKLRVGDPLNVNRPVLEIDDVFDSRKYALSADGRFAAAVVSGGGVQVWSLEDVGAPQWEEDADRLDSVAWSPVRPHLAAMEASGTIWIWNASGMRLTRIQTGVSSVRQTGLAFSPDGNRLATFGPSSVLIYDVSQAEME